MTNVATVPLQSPTMSSAPVASLPSPIASVLAQISSISDLASNLGSTGSPASFSNMLATAMNPTQGATPVQPGLGPVQGAPIQAPSNAPLGNGWAFDFSSSPTNGVANATYPSQTQGSFGASVVSDASKYLGVPYEWGGTNPTSGFDCSGLVQHVFQDLGVNLPRVAADQQKVGTPVPSVAQAQPGDLVFYGSPAYHVGIYIGNGQMIAAPEQGQAVQVDPVGTPTSISRVAPSGTSSSLTQQAGQYLPIFQQAAAANNVNVNLLLAVAKVESNFNPTAVSSAGAQGMMQIMPSTAVGLGINPLDPTQAINGAAKLLSEKLSAFGSPALAAAAYNAGDNAVRTYGGIPPYPETQNYVNAVLSNMTGANS